MDSSRSKSPPPPVKKDIDLKKIISDLNQAIKLREREIQNKLGQLKNSDHLLTEIQGKILETNQEIKKLQLSENEPENRETTDKFVENRDTQEIDKKLNEKLRELASRRLPLIMPSQAKIEAKDPMLVNTVKVLYLKGLKDGDILKFDRGMALVMPVRILRNTKFKDIKELSCNFWELDPHSYSLRAHNFALIEHIEDPIETFIKDQKMCPELWLIHDDKEALKSLTLPDDYFTEGSSKNHFIKNDARANREMDQDGKEENYKKFLETFEGMKNFMPVKSLIIEKSEETRLESWELNVCTLIFGLLLFIFTIVINYSMGSYPVRFWMSHQLSGSILLKFPE